MNIDAINAIGQTLMGGTSEVKEPVSLPAQERFAALMNTPQAGDSPNTMLAVQGTMNDLVVGVDLTAKVAAPSPNPSISW
nr:EscI/YscI/HrpB family type III secretion system inner rod protein [Edwardsiella ictaluri]